ncbi:MAG: 30S ribosomal protein S7 [Chloroflexi bacterium HGW-Chloroflexi-1]|nr:MAG: 30S ribosomal protein S7 [Chloroflexi bacterium HGW-Chloroflexi-1]
MSRRNRPEKREIIPDPRYNNALVSRLVNRLMVNGKKATAERIVYGAMAASEARAKKPALEVLEQAVRNATPIIEVKPRRVGGATYQVPMEIREDRRLALALRWLLQNARKRPGKSMIDKLSAELMDTYNNQGNTIKKKEDTHKMAEANRAFAHYRW